MTQEFLEKKKNWLKNLAKDLIVPSHGSGPLHHYTSLPALFSMLEADAVWVSGTRFSNDASEEQLLQNEDFREFRNEHDSFIMCFSDQEDCLSQWRGYCQNGGAAIEFDVIRPSTYSVLYADYDKSRHYERTMSVPLPVLYVSRELIHTMPKHIFTRLNEDAESGDYTPWTIADIAPYFKDDAFKDENEWRLLFENRNGKLAQCVRFRTLNDGVKIPYMVVKAGDAAKDYAQCPLTPEEFSLEALQKRVENGATTIYIPQGNDQEAIYYKVEKNVIKYNMENNLQGMYRLRIRCEGHLPIRQIMVAPTYNRDRLVEKIKRYCWSNYWLRDVDVVASQIPYIPPSD